MKNRETDIDIKDRRLDNGLRLITIRKAGELMSFNLGFRGGATEDPGEKKGLTHFLEHMLFTGTERRNHDTLNEELEFIGGSMDAYTDIDNLTISMNALRDEMENTFDLISDMVMHSQFPHKELEREKNVILSEYREGLEDLESVTYDRLYERAYPKETLKYSVIGDDRTIRSFTGDDVRRRYMELIRPERAVLVVVSSGEHSAVENLTERYFGSWSVDSTPEKEIEPYPSRNRRGTERLSSHGFDMATVAYHYSFPDLPESYETALKIINNRLGESDNSLLFKEVRLKRGLSYDIYSSLELSEHLRCLEIYCATDSHEVEKVDRIIRNTVNDVRKGVHRIDDRTLLLMKKVLKTNITTLTDDTFSLGSYITSNALENRDLLRYRDEMENIDKVSTEAIGKVLDYVFKNPTVVILKPEKTKADQQ